MKVEVFADAGVAAKKAASIAAAEARAAIAARGIFVKALSGGTNALLLADRAATNANYTAAKKE